MEPSLPFNVVVPPDGRVEMVARPPHLTILLVVQGLFAGLAVWLFRSATFGSRRKDAPCWLRLSHRRRPGLIPRAASSSKGA
jgi:hypothetical protein